MAIHYKIREGAVITCSGEKDRPNYKPRYNENGSYELVEDGVIHSYDDIQAWSPMCDMGQIIERYIRTGDTNLLQRRAAFYADVTNLPKNYAELHNILADADNVFNSLPVAIREQFGNSPAVFYADSAKADSVISEYLRSQSQAAEPVSAPVSPQPEIAVTSPISSVVAEGGATNE